MAQDDNLKVVVVDQNDTSYYLGEVNGLYLSAGSAETGLAVGDKNGFSITLTGQEPNLANTLTADLASVVSGITVES